MWAYLASLPENRAAAQAILDRDLEERLRRRDRMERQGRIGEIRERTKTLPGFIREAWPILEPEMHLEWGWALDAICDHLTAVSNGEVIRLLMNVPPGMMKSMSTGVFWPAFEWGELNRPALRYLGGAFEQGNAERDAKRMKDLVSSDWYQDLYPHVQIVGRGSADEWHNTRTGWRQAKPMGSFTGKRGDRVIIDDPHSVEGGESEAMRKKTLRVMRETVPTRLNDPKRSAIIVIMQRIHEDDVSGMIVAEKMGYSHLLLPMHYDPGRKTISYTRYGEKLFEDPRKYDGELLFPERFDEESIAQTTKEMTAYSISGQMEQLPVPRDGGLFKRTWFEVVKAVPMGGTACRAWDLAGSKKKAEASSDPDWTVGLKGFRFAGTGDFYITDMVRMRETPGKVATAIKNTASQDGYGCTISLAQDPGQAGKWQIEALVALLAGYSIESDTISGDKQLRAGPAATQAEFGKIKILEGDWNADFFAEVCNFPGAKHDDIVDALSDLIRVLSSLTIYDLSGVS